MSVAPALGLSLILSMVLVAPTSAQPAPRTVLSGPNGLAVDPSGGIYVSVGEGTGVWPQVFHFPGTSTTPDRVYRHSPEYAGATPAARVGELGATGFGTASAVAADPAGGVYVADVYLHRVLHFTGTNTTADRVYGQNGSFTTVTPHPFDTQNPVNLIAPGGVAADPAGGLYVADGGRVLHFSAASTTADRIYLQDVVIDAGQGGHALLPLVGAVSVTVDPSGGIYVADSRNNRVLHFNGTSVAADRVYGQNGSFSEYAAANGPTGLTLPRYVAVDTTGGLYVVDATQRVLHYTSTSTTPDRVYNQESGFGGVRGVPTAVAVDPSGGVYIALAPSHVVYIGAGGGTRVYGDDAISSDALTPVATPTPSATQAISPPPTSDQQGVPPQAPSPVPEAAYVLDWSSTLARENDPRVRIVSCDDPVDPSHVICVNGLPAALDLVSYGDIAGDGGLEAAIPLSGGGSLIYRLDGPTPRLVVADGPGGSVSIDPNSKVLVSLDGMTRSTYTLVGEALVQQAACTNVSDTFSMPCD